MTFDEKLGFPTAGHNIIFKLIMSLIPNDWKHLLRTKISQKKLLLQHYNNEGTMKVKDFQNLSNKKIYFTLQSSSSKHNKTFNFIS